jgi:tRNA-Thr(GGU) m(6)t(6)A37 methyltransferase TsaA
MQFVIDQIGQIHTPFTETSGMPIQASRSDTPGWVEVNREFMDGLQGIEDFSRIYLFYVLHLTQPDPSLLVQPFLDDQSHGVFATRYPMRPNRIGFSNVNLISVQDNIIRFTGADMLDGTPLVDIKPYVPDFDVFPAEKVGWYQNRKYK